MPHKLNQKLMMLMLNPCYQARPTAESLLTMITIATGKVPDFSPIGITDSSSYVTCPLLIHIINKRGLRINSEVKRLSSRIIKFVENLIDVNSELYLLTTIWISSKIVLDEPIDLSMLGISMDTILAAERRICVVSRFKFSII